MKKASIKLAALGSPVIWFLGYLTQFAATPLTCQWRSNLTIWTIAAAALLLDFGSGFLAWLQWNGQPEKGMPGTAVMPRWLALGGIALSGVFFIVIVAQAIPSLMLGGCE
jgi:hypothetical protein